jgi:hypothetical protein
MKSNYGFQLDGWNALGWCSLPVSAELKSSFEAFAIDEVGSRGKLVLQTYWELVVQSSTKSDFTYNFKKWLNQERKLSPEAETEYGSERFAFSTDWR